MAERLVPESSNRPDWPRVVAQIVNRLGLRTASLETATDWSLLGNYANDAAAATGGVAIGQLYRNGSVVQVRVT